MEDILKKLLESDTNVIREGTKELKEALRRPETLGSLCHVMATSSETQVRHYAAFIIQKRLSKPSHWLMLNQEAKNHVKNVLMERLVNETEKLVKNAIVQSMAMITLHEPPATTWPELFQFLQHTTVSAVQAEQELGFFTLNLLLESARSPLQPHTANFVLLFNNVLSSLQDLSSPVAFCIIQCMMNLMPCIRRSKQLCDQYVELLPKVIACVKAMAGKRPDKAAKAMDLFYELADPNSIVNEDKPSEDKGGKEGGDNNSPQQQQKDEDHHNVLLTVKIVRPIVKMCLEFIQTKTVKEDLKMRSLNFLSVLASLKIKILEKNDLLEGTIHTLFYAMSQPPQEVEDEEDEEYFSPDCDEDTLLTCASEVLDTMALNMKNETILQPLMKLVEPAVHGTNVYEKRAGYLAMGIVVQACQEYIKANMLRPMVLEIYQGMRESRPVVRNAALFALAQFAEYIQPEMSTFSTEFMPLLISLVQEIVNCGAKREESSITIGGENNMNQQQQQQQHVPQAPPAPSADRVLSCLERFGDILEQGMTPFLPQLMGNLLALTDGKYPEHTRELAIDAVGQLAQAVGKDIKPYFPEIMVKLNSFLTKSDKTEPSHFQVDALDCLASLARGLGEENFRGYTEEAVQLGLSLLQETEDPDLRKSVYALMGAVATIVKADMAPVLNTIMGHIMNSMKRYDGYTSHTKYELEEFYPVYETESEKEDESEEDEYNGVEISNDFADEKEQCCWSVKEMAEYTGLAFAPYLQPCFEEMMKLMSFPNEEVRRAAVEAEFQIVVSIGKLESPETQQVLSEFGDKLMSKAALMVRVEEDKDVVISALEGFSLILNELKQRFLSACPLAKEAILGCIKDVIEGKTEVQSWGDEDEVEEVEESAMEVLPALGKAMDHQDFAVVFAAMMPIFKDRLFQGSSDEKARANYLGVLAQCMEGLGPSVATHMQTLLPFLLCQTQDKASDIRNNSVYTLGEMARHGGQPLFSYYPEILNAFSKLLPVEKRGQVVDNVCGAIARMILANHSGVPLQQVLPVLVSSLPLKEDFEEIKWVFRAVNHLYSLGDQTLASQLVQLVKVSAFSLQTVTPDNDEAKLEICKFIQMCRRDFPNECQTAVSQLPPEAVLVLDALCTSM